MITIKNVRNLLGQLETVNLYSPNDQVIDAKECWMLMPALIDVGAINAVDWKKDAEQALRGGITTIFDLYQAPNGLKKEWVTARKQKIREELSSLKMPLQTPMYLEVTPDTVEELGKMENMMAAIKVAKKHLSNGPFVDRVFQLAAQDDCILILTVDEMLIEQTREMLELAEKYSTQTILLNVSTQEEVELLRQAQRSELLVDGTVSALALLDRDFLWGALKENVVSCVTSSEKYQDRSLILSVLLHGYYTSQILFEEIIEYSRIKPERLLQLGMNGDAVIVDLELPFPISKDRILRGGARFTVLGGGTYEVNQ
jgi:dihydroorotase-like cyclic amidohydrolase